MEQSNVVFVCVWMYLVMKCCVDIEAYLQQNGFENVSYFQISSANSQILKAIPLYHSSLSKFHAQEKIYTYRAGVLCVTEICKGMLCQIS
jgi:vacuolar-type H+-ATPase catalytic subunit A/Vma1